MLILLLYLFMIALLLVYAGIHSTLTILINRIIEGYEYLGVMTSVDTSGRCMLRCTPSTRSLAIDVLRSLSDYVTIEE